MLNRIGNAHDMETEIFEQCLNVFKNDWNQTSRWKNLLSWRIEADKKFNWQLYFIETPFS